MTYFFIWNNWKAHLTSHYCISVWILQLHLTFFKFRFRIATRFRSHIHFLYYFSKKMFLNNISWKIILIYAHTSLLGVDNSWLHRFEWRWLVKWNGKKPKQSNFPLKIIIKIEIPQAVIDYMVVEVELPEKMVAA